MSSIFFEHSDHDRRVRPIHFARIGFVSVLVATGAFFGICNVELVSAAKPGGGGAHTSLILFSTYQQPPTIFQMYEDGTSKTAALSPYAYGAPSSRTYGGARWWLTSEIDLLSGFSEIFAFRSDGSANVQLTELGSDGIEIGDEPRWSNDLLDSSVTVQVGWDADPVDGTNETYVIRLPLNGAVVSAIAANLVPRLTVADCEFLLTMPQPSPGDSSVYSGYACSSDPLKLAYLMSKLDVNGDTIDRTIWVRTLASNPMDPPVDVAIHTAPKLSLSAWAHDGNRIAFVTLNTSSWGGVWTIQPDGLGLLRVKANSGTMTYSKPYWSPNSQELLVQTIKSRVGDWYYNLARMPASGGTLTVLTNDMPQSLGKSPEGWIPLGL